jgi:hypothetical protein
MPFGFFKKSQGAAAPMPMENSASAEQKQPEKSLSMFKFKKADSTKKLTNYLGHLLDTSRINYEAAQYNGVKIAGADSPTNKTILGNYEAVLTQAAYMSRLSYEPNNVIAQACNLVNYNPVVFNTGLSMIRQAHSRGSSLQKAVNKAVAFAKSKQAPADPNFYGPKPVSVLSQPFIGNGAILNEQAKDGVGLIDNVSTPYFIQIVDYRGYSGASPHAGSKVLYISFRGTLSFRSTITDLKGAPRNLMQMMECARMRGDGGSNITGVDAFKEYLDTAAEQGAKLSAHGGFVQNLIPVVGNACYLLDNSFLGDGTVDNIIVTGHSLGGANATLFAMLLAAMKKAGAASLARPSIHCITFGAPKLLSDYSRLVFNQLLDEGYMTLDRVANRAAHAGAFLSIIHVDPIPVLPLPYVHPGYMILKTEIKTQSRTGRSKSISNIREMFAGIPQPGKMNFNNLPTYKEFLNCFDRIPPMDDASYDLYVNNAPFGTIYENMLKIKGIINKNPQKILETYQYISQVIVKAILGFPGKIDENQVKSEAESLAADAESAESVISKIKDEGVEGQVGGLSLIGKSATAYKNATVARGPNHIVYGCKKNITPFLCHLGTMGIGFIGNLKNVALNRVPYAKLVKEGQMLHVVEVIKKDAPHRIQCKYTIDPEMNGPQPSAPRAFNKTRRLINNKNYRNRIINKSRATLKNVSNKASSTIKRLGAKVSAYNAANLGISGAKAASRLLGAMVKP